MFCALWVIIVIGTPSVAAKEFVTLSHLSISPASLTCSGRMKVAPIWTLIKLDRSAFFRLGRATIACNIAGTAGILVHRS